jgi:hypothetical protein
MKKLINLVAGPIAAALLCVASVSPSHAAATTAFVSGNGNNSNACTVAAPCRDIFVAVTVAGNGGTVSCLDAGPYTTGIVSSGGSFTLDCRGVVSIGSVTSYVFTDHGTAGQLVTIRHVTFDGLAGGIGAAQMTGGGTAVFEDCTFQNFTASPGVAMQFAPTTAGAQLIIKDSVFANNGAGGGVGEAIFIVPNGGSAKVVIERTQIVSNTSGIIANGSGGLVLAEIKDSTISGNAVDGIIAVTAGPTASIVVKRSSLDHNGGAGAVAQGAGAYVSVNDSTVDWNAVGLNTSSGGTILSYQNNMIAGNLSPGVTPLSVGQQ